VAPPLALMDLKIVDTVGDNQGDQREYGVIEPDRNKLKLGDTGCGEQVIMKNKKGKTLLDLVIGKEVPDRPGLQLRREGRRGTAYTSSRSRPKALEKFEIGSSANLLQINSLDTSRLEIRDYAIKNIREGLAIASAARWNSAIATRPSRSGRWSRTGSSSPTTKARRATLDAGEDGRQRGN